MYQFIRKPLRASEKKPYQERVAIEQVLVIGILLKRIATKVIGSNIS